MKEFWKDIPGYEGIYQVSSAGRVKALERIRLNRGKFPFVSKERILKPNKDNRGTGYLKLDLWKNKKCRTFPVHKLVAMAFLGHKPCGYKLVINHKNFNTLDNRVENLEIVTQRENANKKHVKSYSKYTGVSWNKISKKWTSQIYFNGKLRHLGNFENEYDAHLAYQIELTIINQSLTLKKVLKKTKQKTVRLEDETDAFLQSYANKNKKSFSESLIHFVIIGAKEEITRLRS